MPRPSVFKISLYQWLILFPLLFIINFGTSLSQDIEFAALPTDPLKAAEHQQATRQILAENRAAIEQLRQDIANAQPEISQNGTLVTTAIVEQAQLDDEAVRLKVENLETQITSTKRKIKTLEQAISSLEAQEQLLNNPAKNNREQGNSLEQLVQLRTALDQRRTDLKLEIERLSVLDEWLALTKQHYTLTSKRYAQLEEIYLQKQAQERLEAQQDLATRLEREQQIQLEKTRELRDQLRQEGETLPSDQRQLLEVSIQVAEERANLLRWDIRLSAIKDELANWQGLVDAKDSDPRRLQAGLNQLMILQNELRAAGESINHRLESLSQTLLSYKNKVGDTDQRKIHEKATKLLIELENEFRQRHNQLSKQSERLKKLRDRMEDSYKKQARKDVFLRETLIIFTPKKWDTAFAEIRNAPRILFHQIWLGIESAIKTMNSISDAQRILLTIVCLLPLIIAALGHRFLNNVITKYNLQDASFISKFTITMVRLLYGNIWGIALVGMLALALWQLSIPQPGLGILLTLILFLVCIKVPLTLARLLLIAPDMPISQRRHNLYALIFWMVMIGGGLVTLVILARLSQLPHSAIRVIDQILMLFWLATYYPLLRLRALLLNALTDHYHGRIWLSILRLLTLLLPLILAAAALVGLAGYINLSWLVLQRLFTLTGGILLWWLLRGLINDGFICLKNYAITQSNHGLLWTQEILEPLNRTLQRLLLLIGIVVLFEIYSRQGGFLFIFWNSLSWEPILMVLILALLSYEAILLLAASLVEYTQSNFGAALIRHLRRPLSLIVPITVTQILLATLELSPNLIAQINHALVLVQIAMIGWLVVRLTSVGEDIMHQHYLVNSKDSLGARRIRTQFQMLRRIVVVIVQLVALSVMMMTFPKIRELGAGLLASAGVAGLVIGVAARPFLENLIAGIQIGLTQPIRIDDVVIVESEWGRIAEINATHVVVQIWDDRRLIVPLNYFNTKPFQNWTWVSSDLLGTVFFYVDYTFPVEIGRQELKQILDETELWDGREWGLSITNTTDRTIEIRALISAADASIAWQLRCLVREKFIAFLQSNYPQCLPRTRFSEMRENQENELLLTSPTGGQEIAS